MKKGERIKATIALSINTTSVTGKVNKVGRRTIPSIPHNTAAVITKNGANFLNIKMSF